MIILFVLVYLCFLVLFIIHLVYSGKERIYLQMPLNNIILSGNSNSVMLGWTSLLVDQIPWTQHVLWNNLYVFSVWFVHLEEPKIAYVFIEEIFPLIEHLGFKEL
jgi:hypothetical protein